MYRKIYLLYIALFIGFSTYAQSDTNSHLRISLLTCGVGDEIWSVFGHTGVRVVDSAKGIDIVYNYGTFDGYDKDFEMNFMRGKLLYYVTTDDYKDFIQEYVTDKRRVQEQVVLLDNTKKENIFAFLRTNAMPENRYYKYDFILDNCATRIRDIFPDMLGRNFKFGTLIAPGQRITYRNIIDQYLYRKHWERVGIDLLLGSHLDKVMTNEDIMFLPDYLRDGLGGATLKGKKIMTAPEQILPGSAPQAAGINQPLVLCILIAILTIAGLYSKKLRWLGKTMSVILLFTTGLLGCLILVMWFGTDHPTCRDNVNILWALPTNLLLLFNFKGRSRYALIAIVLLLVSLLLHLFKIQEMPISALWPLFLALLYVYGSIYRSSKIKPA